MDSSSVPPIGFPPVSSYPQELFEDLIEEMEQEYEKAKVGREAGTGGDGYPAGVTSLYCNCKHCLGS